MCGFCLRGTHRCMGSPFLNRVPDPETQVQTDRHLNTNSAGNSLRAVRFLGNNRSNMSDKGDDWKQVILAARIHTCSLRSSEHGPTFVTEELCEQCVGRRDHCRWPAWQMIEQPGYGGHCAAFRFAQPCCRGQNRQVARQQHHWQNL